jgi:hypothetical protein
MRYIDTSERCGTCPWHANGGVTRHAPVVDAGYWSLYRVRGGVIEWYSISGAWNSNHHTAMRYQHHLAQVLHAEFGDHYGDESIRLVPSPY